MIFNLENGSFVAVAFSSVQSLYGQYPTIPDDIQKATDKMMTEAMRHSDEAWNKAYPIVQSEATMGRPYIPWAARDFTHHKYMIGVYSHILLCVIGYLASLMFKSNKDIRSLTYYGYLDLKKQKKRIPLL